MSVWDGEEKKEQKNRKKKVVDIRPLSTVWRKGQEPIGPREGPEGENLESWGGKSFYLVL
jgi:hypothetical protein